MWRQDCDCFIAHRGRAFSYAAKSRRDMIRLALAGIDPYQPVMALLEQLFRRLKLPALRDSIAERPVNRLVERFQFAARSLTAQNRIVWGRFQAQGT